jgi:hypothetical protein
MLIKSDTSKVTHSQDFPSWITKECVEDICVPVTEIINSMLEQRQYPARYKTAEVRPLKKVTTPNSFKDYRPISLLWRLGKIMEKAMMSIYKPVVLPALKTNQFAYLPSLGTVDALVSAVDDWTIALDSKQNIGIQAVLKDFSKAFDKMSPNILLAKLSNMNVNGGLIRLCKDFLSNRHQLVSLNGEKSSLRETNIGVPQGTICGPLFWLVYVDDLQPPKPITTIKYADDTTCFVSLDVNNVITNIYKYSTECANYTH